MRLSRIVREMEVLPRGYAVAYFLPLEARAVCYPVGLHAVVSAARAAWLAFRTWRAPDVIEHTYHRGQSDAWQAARRLEDSRETSTIRLMAVLLEPYPEAAAHLRQEAARMQAVLDR